MKLINLLKIPMKIARAVSSDQKCTIRYLNKQIKGKVHKNQSIVMKNINFKIVALKINLKPKCSIMMISAITAPKKMIKQLIIIKDICLDQEDTSKTLRFFKINKIQHSQDALKIKDTSISTWPKMSFQKRKRQFPNQILQITTSNKAYQA